MSEQKGITINDKLQIGLPEEIIQIEKQYQETVTPFLDKLPFLEAMYVLDHLKERLFAYYNLERWMREVGGVDTKKKAEEVQKHEPD